MDLIQAADPSKIDLLEYDPLPTPDGDGFTHYQLA